MNLVDEASLYHCGSIENVTFTPTLSREDLVTLSTKSSLQ